MIKGLVFDLDGVISETAPLHFKAWKWILEQNNIPYTKEENDQLKGLSRLDTLRRILEMKSLSISEEQIQAWAKSKNDYYVANLESGLTKDDVLPGIKKLLDRAKTLNLKLAIASSSFNAPLILKAIGLFDYFDYIVNPGEISKGKPDPEIFVKAAQGLNLNVNEVIGFEDAVEGAKGLFAARIFTVAITYGVKNQWDQFSNLQVETTADLDLDKIIKAYQVTHKG